jgi:precorrin-6B methylase 2
MSDPANRGSGRGYLDPYRDAVRDLGASFGSLLWKSPEAQRMRFDVIIDACALRGRVVADMGAGLGDLAVRMHERGVEYGRYLAVEGVDELAEAARGRLASVPECVVVEGDFVAEERQFASLVRDHGAEVFAFSGSLNTLAQHEAERVLGRAWDALKGTRGGQLVFNFLSDRGARTGEDTGPAHRFDTAGMTAWALDRTPLVALRTDYWQGHDATVWMGS